MGTLFAVLHDVCSTIYYDISVFDDLDLLATYDLHRRGYDLGNLRVDIHLHFLTGRDAALIRPVL